MPFNILTLAAIAASCVGLLVAGCSRREAAPERAPSGLVAELDTASFEREITNGVVLVDFWAAWCGPCRTQGPIVETVAGQVQGQARVAKVDVDAAPELAQRYGIRSIPTLIVFNQGVAGQQFVGVTKAETLVAAIAAAGKP